MYRYMIIFCCLNRVVVSYLTFKIEEKVTSTGCDGFTILGTTPESVTYKITGDLENYAFNRFITPSITFANNSAILCSLINAFNNCTVSTASFYTCKCEKTNEAYFFTFTNNPSKTLQSFQIFAFWEERGNTTKSELFTVKAVKGRRNCWVPTIEILNTAESTSCSDFLMLGTDYQMVTFNISWSTDDYTLDSLGTPTVVNASSGGNLCPLIGQDMKCLLRELEDFSCLCEEITPDEYHLTFKFTPKQTGDSFPIHMKWRGQNEAKDIISEKYTLKDVKDKDCEGTLTTTLLGVGIAIGALIVIAGGVYASQSMKAGPNITDGNAGMNADERESTHVVQSDETIRRSTLVKVTGSAVDFNPSTQV